MEELEKVKTRPSDWTWKHLCQRVGERSMDKQLVPVFVI
jgi:hypothetical protein